MTYNFCQAGFSPKSILKGGGVSHTGKPSTLSYRGHSYYSDTVKNKKNHISFLTKMEDVMKHSPRYLFILLILAAFSLSNITNVNAINLRIGDAYGLPGNSQTIKVLLENPTLSVSEIKALKFTIKDVLLDNVTTVVIDVPTGTGVGPYPATGSSVTSFPLSAELVTTVHPYVNYVGFFYKATAETEADIIVSPKPEEAGLTTFLAPGMGVLLDLNVSIPAGIERGKQVTIDVSDLVVIGNGDPSVNANPELDVTFIPGNFWIGSKGDVDIENGDPLHVDLFDVLMLVDFVLGKINPNDYQKWAGDIVNSTTGKLIEDGGVPDGINIADITAAMDKAVDITLSIQPNPEGQIAGNMYLSFEQIRQVKDQTFELPIVLQSSTSIRGVQMVLNIDPKTYNVQAVKKTLYSQNLKIVQNYEKGKLRLLIVDLEGKDLPAGNIPLATIPFSLKKTTEDNKPIEIEYATAATESGSRLEVLYDNSTAQISEAPVPKTFALHQNSPNPFNMTTTIQYDVPQLQNSTHVNLSIFNTNGQLVRTLVDQNKSAGSYKVSWDGRDSDGFIVATGVYFYSMSADHFVLNKKLVVTK